MGKPSSPKYPTVQAAQVPTGGDLYNQGLQFINQNGLGYTLSAQGNALQEAQSPAYYNSFQPSSFAEALANQSFKNIWPNEQAAIQQQQSNTGQAYSPGAAESTGNAYGNLATGIGEYLNQQGMQEAMTGIQAGLGISPNEVLSPYVQTAANQANTQAGLNQQANFTNASGSYANQLEKYNQQMGLGQAIGSGVGAAGGFVVGGPAGAALGAGLGGSLYGSQNSMAPYIQAMQGYNASGQNQPFGGLFGGGGSGASGVSGNTGYQPSGMGAWNANNASTFSI